MLKRKLSNWTIHTAEGVGKEVQSETLIIFCCGCRKLRWVQVELVLNQFSDNHVPPSLKGSNGPQNSRSHQQPPALDVFFLRNGRCAVFPREVFVTPVVVCSTPWLASGKSDRHRSAVPDGSWSMLHRDTDGLTPLHTCLRRLGLKAHIGC